ncbi:MAG: zinc ribbon domain-containing protein, partial [Dehalococcoidia bacterium]
MSQIDPIHYCTNCGRGVPVGSPYCNQCGWPAVAGPKERVRQVATILNELSAPTMRSAIPAEAHAGLEAHYTVELETFVAPRSTPQRQSTAPARRTVAVAAKPREPMDWSWLADQQANLLLFAGAFLTIVAALIYVGYSEQAVSGALKMTLLAGYTLAFIAAGAACLRSPRVVMAGHVFLGVGAVLVPMNFAAARSIFGGGDLGAESMWFAGSVVSAAFYTAIARIGLGRGYAVAAGVALISAAIAAIVAFDVPSEWAPLVGIATAALLVAPLLFADDVTKRRIGEIWQFHAHAAAIGAVAWALGVAGWG